MRSIPLCFAVLGAFICAADAPAEIANLDASLFAAELTHDRTAVDRMGWGHQSSTRYEVIMGSVRVSFLVQQSDNPRDGLGPPKAMENNSLWQDVAGELDGQIQLTPACAPEPVDGDSIPESFGGIAGQSLPEPTTVLLLASSAVVFSRRWLRR